MTARRIIVPGAMPSRDDNGRALPAILRFYEPGTARNELKPVYTDNTLNIELEQPILSNASGYFVQIWADDAETFDVARSDQVYDRLLSAETNISPANDAVLASAELAEAAAALAEASSDTAVAAQVIASAAAVTASAAATTASSAADRAVLAAGFDPDDYVQVAAQTLTTPQKLQARTNIGAVSQSDVDASIDARGLVRSVRTSNTILGPDDNASYVDVTAGTFTQTASSAVSLGADWFLDYGNSGTGVVTVDPSGSQAIGGLPTLTVYPGEVYRIISDGANLQVIALKTDLGPHVIFQDQKASGTAGGAHSGTGYVSRAFNTTVRGRVWASLSSGNPVLDAGTYFISAFAAYGQQGAGDPVRAKIQNTTDAAVAILGPGHRTNIDLGGFTYVSGVVTITAQKTFDLQQYMLNNVDTDAHGYAVSTGDVEIFAEFAATRLF